MSPIFEKSCCYCYELFGLSNCQVQISYSANFPVCAVVKNPPANARDAKDGTVAIPG